MNRSARIVIYGFIMWIIPFIVSFVIFPLKNSMNPLFESIMPVVITVVVVTLSYYYLKDIKTNFEIEGVKIGVMWFLISIIIDLILFLPPSPMQMSFTDYMMDIGLTYLIIPAVTIGFGYMIKNKA